MGSLGTFHYQTIHCIYVGSLGTAFHYQAILCINVGSLGTTFHYQAIHYLIVGSLGYQPMHSAGIKTRSETPNQ